MKTFVTFASAAALSLSSFSAHAGGVAEPIVENEVFVVEEESAGSLGGFGWAIPLAVVAAVVLLADDDDSTGDTGG